MLRHLMPFLTERDRARATHVEGSGRAHFMGR